MSSREYLTGAPEDRAALDWQLRRLYGQRSITLMGSMGRQALYASFDWDVPSLSIRDEWGRLRDLDVVTPHYFVTPSKRPHQVDMGLNYIFHLSFGNEKRVSALWDAENRQPVSIDPRTIRRQTRWLDDSPVHTFKLSTHWYVEQLVTASEKAGSRQAGDANFLTPDEQQVYDASFARFDEFVAAMRDKHPREFLPKEYYEPFQRLIDQQNRRYPDDV